MENILSEIEYIEIVKGLYCEINKDSVVVLFDELCDVGRVDWFLRFLFRIIQ